MYLYIELWKGRDAWNRMATESRKSWMDNTLSSLQQHLQKGNVEMVGLAGNENDTPRSAGFDFAAVWRMPDKSAAVDFENFVDQIGWHEYFEQVNFRGQLLEMDEFVSGHVNLGKGSAAA